MMKKKLITIVMGMVFWAGLFGGCGQTEVKQDNAITNSSEEGKAFIPVRKKGKLPCETVSAEYDLEYGKAEIEIHKDAVKPGQKVVLVDDLIATGGTMEASCKLVEQLGGEVVKILFLMELAGLKGREKLAKYDVASVITYEGK